MKITTDLFNAYLHCPTKCWLRSRREPSGVNSYAEWIQSHTQIYWSEGLKHLLRKIPSAQCSLAPAESMSWKAAKWPLAVDVTVQAFPLSGSYTLESLIDAIERVSSPRRSTPMQFIPMRFVAANKLTKNNRLLLAFDAWVFSEALGSEVKWGSIVHKDRYLALRVNIAPLIGEVRKLVEELAALLAGESAPELVLNRHCAECEFQVRCRKLAMEKDDLSLLEAITGKERRKLHRKGIFTVTQLSYTFRPRKHGRLSANTYAEHHHSLKALAIREQRIHIVGRPKLKIEGTAVYLDVEGLPDRDFYYLIGARVRCGDLVHRHSLWAENPAQEEEIWNKFLNILAAIEKPVLIHYGRYERSFLKRMCERYTGPTGNSIVDQALKLPVNLLTLLFSQIYVPTYSNRLKDVAVFFGATWHSPNITGIQTIALRCEWERTHSARLKEVLLAYNQDDCAALELLCLEIGRLITESELRPDIDFPNEPKKVATECGSQIHRTTMRARRVDCASLLAGCDFRCCRNRDSVCYGLDSEGLS